MNFKAIGRGQWSRISVIVAALLCDEDGRPRAANQLPPDVRVGDQGNFLEPGRTAGPGWRLHRFQYVNGGSTTWSFGGPLLVWPKAVPVTGTYFVNGVVNVALPAGDEAWWAINNNAPATTAANNTGAKVDMTIPITAVVTQNAGTNVTLDCSDVKENGSSQVAQFAFMGILVTTSS